MIVYLIGDGDGRYKIGHTRQAAKTRLKQLQTGSATKLELVAECLVKNPTKVESILHRRYGEYRLEGEWFALPAEDVESFVAVSTKCDEMVSVLIEGGNPFI
jgi:hypothetical protein